MLTISQLAAYAGVTVRAVRHYHQIGLLPEPERDASGYRRYGATAVVSLIKIRTLANAGVPLSQIGELLEADGPAFADAVKRIDDRLRDEVERLETSRRQIAQLEAGDSLLVPPEVACYLDRLRQIGASERIVQGERDGWILVAARWPEMIREWMPDKLAQLEDPRLVRLYRVLSEIGESDGGDDDPRLAEAADILADLLEQAYAARRHAGERVGERRPAVRPPGRIRGRVRPADGTDAAAHARAWLGRLVAARAAGGAAWVVVGRRLVGAALSGAALSGPPSGRGAGRVGLGLGGGVAGAGAHGGGELVASVAVVAEATEAGGGRGEQHDPVRARPREGRRDGCVQVGAV